jgi:glutaredoxin 3
VRSDARAIWRARGKAGIARAAATVCNGGDAMYGGAMRTTFIAALVALSFVTNASMARADSAACAEVAQRFSRAAAKKSPVFEARKMVDALSALLETDPACQAAPHAAFGLVVAAWGTVLPPYKKKLTRPAIAAEMARIQDVTQALGAVLLFEHTGLTGHVSLTMGKVQEATAHFLRRQGDLAVERQPGVDALYNAGKPNPWRTWILRARASYERAVAALSDPRDAAARQSAQGLLDTLRRTYLARPTAPRPKRAEEPEPEAAPEQTAAAEAAPAEAAPRGRRRGMQPDVVIFTTSWCPSCSRAKEWFKQNDVKFREVDIETEPDGKEQEAKYARRAGIKPESLKSIPVVFVGDKGVTGFRAAWLAEQLGL